MVNKGILWITSLVFTIIGLIDAIYLTWIKITHNESQCIQGVGNCFSVNTSPYSEWNGIPIALIGAIGYVAILVMLLAEMRLSFASTNGPLVVFGLSLVGVVYSAYLTLIEFAVIKAVCPFCLISALAMLVLFVTSIVRLVGKHET